MESSVTLLQAWGFSDCSQGILDMGHNDCLITSYMLQLQGQKPQTCTQRLLGGWHWPPRVTCAVQPQVPAHSECIHSTVTS